MTEGNPIDTALGEFRLNRGLAQRHINSLTNQLAQTESRFFLIKWFRRWQIGGEITQVQSRVRAYGEAERGLNSGNFAPAIDVLYSIAERIDESPFETEPTLENVLNSPVSRAFQMRQLAQRLSNLQQ